MAASFAQKDIRLLLAGKTGCGKSSLANSVFNKDIFRAKCQPTSVTKKCQQHSQMIQDTQVTVVDTPGFFDTNNDVDIDGEMKHCIDISVPGPHVILNVVSIGRFTEEDSKAIKFFNDKFGHNVSKYSLLVLTRFDDYKRDTGRTDFDFGSFIRNLPSESRSLLRSTFEDRYIPFDNTLSGRDALHQLAQLMQKVNDIIATNDGRHYTNDDFKKAENAIKMQREKELENKRCTSFNFSNFVEVVGYAAENTMHLLAIFDAIFGK